MITTLDDALSDSTTLVTIVIVLYRRAALESEALSSLQGILEKYSHFAVRVMLVLYDNSPSSDSAFMNQLPFEVQYVADPANGGLACAYQYALKQAETSGSDWLLLLDQDTTLSEEYWLQLVDSMQQNRDNKQIVAIVPFLETQGQTLSPEESFFFQLRHQFPRARHHPISDDATGPQIKQINAFNSGAAIKVAALRAVGGFPSGFHLDYLDHATFHLLQSDGSRVCVLPAVLQQAFSHFEIDSVPYSRHQSVVRGQIRFVTWFGTWIDRLLLRLWFLRKGRYYYSVCKDPRVWKIMVRSAVGPWARELRDN